MSPSLPLTCAPDESGTRPARWIPLAAALLLALVAGVVGVERVAPDFARIRLILVRQATVPGPDGQVVVPVGAAPHPLPVLIVRATGGLAGGRLDVRAGDRLVSSVLLRPGASVRFDIQVRGGLVPGAALRLAGTDGWRLDYLEAANLHGFSSGMANLVIVPAGWQDHARLPWWLAIGLASFLFLIGARRPTSRVLPRGIRYVLAAIGISILGSVIVAPIVSRYALLLDTSTYLLCVVLVWVEPLVDGYRAGRRRLASRLPGGGVRLVDSAVVLTASVLFFAAATNRGLKAHEGNYSGFLYLTPSFAASPVLDPYPEVRRSLVVHESGYDGQLMFLMAFDPFMTRFEPERYTQVVDTPGYRYGRIGFSALTRLVARGHPAAFPATMVWLVAAGGVLTTFFMLRLAREADASPWQALLCLLTPGFVVSLARAMPEPIAAALLLAGLWAYLRSSKAVAIAAWSASLLVRETGALLVLTVVACDLWKSRDARRSLWPLLAMVPLAIWRAYVGWRLAGVSNVDGWWHRPSELALPFAGLVRLFLAGGIGEEAGRAYNQFLPVLLVALAALALAVWRARPGPAAAGAVGYALMAVSFDYAKVLGWAGNAERAAYEAFLLLFAAMLPFGRLPVRLRWAFGAFAIALFVYDFHYGTHSHWFRSALLLFG